MSSWGREDPGEDLCLSVSATSKIDNLGAKSDLLANIEKQLKSGDVSKSVEHKERELADGDTAQEQSSYLSQITNYICGEKIVTSKDLG